MRKLAAVVIGHKQEFPGAKNESYGITEFEFNDYLSKKIQQGSKNTSVIRVYRTTYKNLPMELNTLHPDFIISLHCNAYDTQVSGTEVLYYYKSKNGKIMASILQKHLLKALDLKNRGIKPKTAEDRGGYLLKYTKAPCVIAEPFFIDNDSDYVIAACDIDKLVQAYVNAIDEISENL